MREAGGPRLNRISQALAERGVTSVAVVRVLPLAPFTVVNLVAGSSHIALRDFVLGTIAGMTPGLMVMALASEKVMVAVQDPGWQSISMAVAGVVLMVGAIAGIRSLVRRYAKIRPASSLPPCPTPRGHGR